MGIVLSVVNFLRSFFKSQKYVLTEIETSNSKKLHSACRSTNPNKLISYQSKIDNLKLSEVVYVNLNNKLFLHK